MNLLDMIALETGLGAIDADRIIATAPVRYKQYPIPKRSGGVRIIAQPSRELKVLQRLVLKHWLSALPVHPTAAAYVVGRNIRENADQHRHNEVILKLDFQSFFPSIRVVDWRRYTALHPPPWDGAGDSARLANILFWGGGGTRAQCLSIGAPTSPLISNLMMFDLDTKFHNAAIERNLVYTRYADDITLSGQTIEAVVSLEQYIRDQIRRCKSPKLTINEHKRGVYTMGRRRMVTGLIITPLGQISLGRQRKREIASLIHRYLLEQLSPARLGYLKGMLGYAVANEPEFLQRMRTKYGSAVIDQILRTHIPPERSVR